jgi:non-heme chloroperoxidase
LRGGDSRNPEPGAEVWIREAAPIGATGLLSAKLVPKATLKVVSGAPHGLCTTLKEKINDDLLAFITE